MCYGCLSRIASEGEAKGGWAQSRRPYILKNRAITRRRSAISPDPSAYMKGQRKGEQAGA